MVQEMRVSDRKVHVRAEDRRCWRSVWLSLSRARALSFSLARSLALSLSLSVLRRLMRRRGLWGNSCNVRVRVRACVRACERESERERERARERVSQASSGSLALEDMAGGTFTISNGGVFGSMMSMPIVNQVLLNKVLYSLCNKLLYKPFM